jgi:replication-associated recombination protein RarA
VSRDSERVRFAEQETPNGHLCGEVASAMQKSIRRGQEREALYWASELDLAGFGNYVWKRLRIIASEDVGLASTETVLAVRALYENWLELRKTVRDDRQQGFVRIFLLHAVCLLCRSPKSRMLDHALIVAYAGEREPLEVPDHALDMHTAKGRRKGRGAEHFLAEGARLANEADVDDPYRDEAERILLSPPQRRPRGQLMLDE